MMPVTETNLSDRESVFLRAAQNLAENYCSAATLLRSGQLDLFLSGIRENIDQEIHTLSPLIPGMNRAEAREGIKSLKEKVTVLIKDVPEREKASLLEKRILVLDTVVNYLLAQMLPEPESNLDAAELD